MLLLANVYFSCFNKPQKSIYRIIHLEKVKKSYDALSKNEFSSGSLVTNFSKREPATVKAAQEKKCMLLHLKNVFLSFILHRDPPMNDNKAE